MAVSVAANRVALPELEAAFEAVWSRVTSADPANWSDANRAWGQCAVTALIVQDYLDGELRRGDVGSISHYWNLLPSGEVVDLTHHQFGGDIEIVNVEPRSRDYVLSHPDTLRRYRKLAEAVCEQLQRLRVR
jgi:hypothetical protein